MLLAEVDRSDILIDGNSYIHFCDDLFSIAFAHAFKIEFLSCKYLKKSLDQWRPRL
jgi:hypothetical protein